MNTFEENAGRIARCMGRAAGMVAPPPPMLVGQVLSISPLRVQAGGLTLDAGALRINADLLPGYSPELAGELKGTSLMGEVVTPVEAGDLTRKTIGLSVGDRVILFSEDLQVYHILCKVVAAG